MTQPPPSTGRTIQVKMARGTQDDIQRLSKFLEFLESFCEDSVNSYAESNDDGEYPTITDEEALEIINKEFSRFTCRATVMASWRRVVWGFEILVDNCCDLKSDVLEWNEELRELIAFSEFPALEPHPFTPDALQLALE